MSVQTWRVAAYGVVIENEQILLCQLTESRRWTLPGGGLDFAEHPKQAVAREVEEETGLTVSVHDVIGVHSYTLARPDDALQCIQIVYRATVTGGSLRSELNGTTDLCQWQNINELSALDTVDMIHELLSGLY